MATIVSIPVVRGPIVTARTLAAVDILSGDRLWLWGVGPGSSERDYAALRIPCDERWKHFNELIQVLRALWTGDSESFNGNFNPMRVSTCSRIPFGSLDLRSGSPAGGQKRGCGELLATVVDCSPQDTTPHREDSHKTSLILGSNYRWWEKHQTPSRMVSPPCGYT